MFIPQNPNISESCIALFKDAVQDDNFNVKQYMSEKEYLLKLDYVDRIVVLSWFQHYVTINQITKEWTVRPMVKWKFENGHYDKELSNHRTNK